MRTTHLVCATLAALAAAAPAQLQPGEAAPDVKVDESFNLPHFHGQSLAAFRGTALLIEYWQTWCGPCKAQVPHLNELQEKFGRKGLIVVGVTQEPRERVEKFVADNAVTHPIVIESDNASAQKLGIRSYPSAFLLDAEGRLVWSGHPASLDEATLARAMQGARPAVLGLGKELDAQRKFLEADELGVAHGNLRALLEGGKLSAAAKEQARVVIAGIEQDAAAMTAEAEAASQRQDWVGAADLLARTGTRFAGLPAASAAQKKLAELRSRPEARREIDAWTRLLQARKLEGTADHRQADDAYRALEEAFAGTRAAGEAARARAALRQQHQPGFDPNCADCAQRGAACKKHGGG